MKIKLINTYKALKTCLAHAEGSVSDIDDDGGDGDVTNHGTHLKHIL